MWDDIKMWLYLRLLNSEMLGYMRHDFGTDDDAGQHFGSKCCEVDTERYFRIKENFMRRVQTQGWSTYFVALPYIFHHTLSIAEMDEQQEEEVTDKTRSIFGAAGSLKYLDYPTRTSYPTDYEILTINKERAPITYKDKERIAISYGEGTRFVSWSGLVGHLYHHHLSFAAVIWSIFLFVSVKFLGLIGLTCDKFPRIPMC